MKPMKAVPFDKYKSFNKIALVFLIYLFLSFAGCVMVVFRAAYVSDIKYLFLIWNLFLAWIPLCLTLVMTYIYSFYGRSIWRSVLMFTIGGVWMVFYPNAPYIITDFIHLSGVRYYSATMGYNVPFIVWYDFIMFSLFILTGFLLGFVSLYIMQRLIQDRFSSWLGWFFSSCTMFISSFGIYLGRFIRWNSWDVLVNPVSLIDSIFDSFHMHALAFTVTFGLFLLLIYIALYNLTYLCKYNVNLS